MRPSNLEKIHASFSRQAAGFESKSMSFSKQEYLEYTVQKIQAGPEDRVLEVAAGTCACGRAIAPGVRSVTCLDATPAMLKVGRQEAEQAGLTNMEFVSGYAEALPFDDGSFDVVMTRLSFHHFTEMEAPFREMHRVLKLGGKLVIIDMEAAEEPLRQTEDRIETMRDCSHVKNRSREELLALYECSGCEVLVCESTKIPVSLKAWMELTKPPEEIRAEILRLMKAELSGGEKTGFSPYEKDGEVFFDQRWLLILGRKA